MSDPQYEAARQRLRIVEGQIKGLDDLQATFMNPGITRSASDAQLLKQIAGSSSLDLATALVANSNPELAKGLASAGGTLKDVEAARKMLNAQRDDIVTELYAIDPGLAWDEYPDIKRIKEAKAASGGSGQQVTYQVQIMRNGDVVRTSSAGGWEKIDSRPEYADKNVQVITDKTTGEAFALTLDNNGDVVNRKSLGLVAFPEINPADKFKLDVLTSAANVEQSMAGLELTQRGQMIKAIGDDLSMQVQLGNMVYTEAQTNLARVNAAYTQRREERAQMLKYAVTRSSLRTNALGETVTQLPFSSQLSGILGAATGRQFSESDFQLGTTTINPDQAGQDVLDATAYESPIPRLAAALSTSRTMIEGILGKPLGSQAASQQLVQAAMPPTGAR